MWLNHGRQREQHFSVDTETRRVR